MENDKEKESYKETLDQINSLKRENEESRNEIIESIKGLKKSSNKNFWINIFISFLAIFFGFIVAYYFFLQGVDSSLKLSEESINKTFWLTKPVTLNVTHFYNETAGRLYINVTNLHPLRETGSLYLYRIEISSNKPHMFFEQGLKPGESHLFSLTAKKREAAVDADLGGPLYGRDFTLPAVRTYFANEYASISYKVACDNCPSQGIIRRLPDFSVIDFTITLSIEGVKNVTIPVYEWTDYKLDDVLKGE